MGKLKATLTDAADGTGAGMPISGSDAPGAQTPGPALVVFGKDDAGKAHASWFSADDAELAIKAAGLMGMRVLPVTTDEHRAAASQLPAGKVFESGRGFVPFCKGAAYTALMGFEGSYAPPPPAEPEPTSMIAVTAIPRSWADLAPGSLVLASPGEDEGWWASVIVEARGEDLFVLRWDGFDDEPTFVRRGADLGLMPPSAAIMAEAETVEPDGGASA